MEAKTAVLLGSILVLTTVSGGLAANNSPSASHITSKCEKHRESANKYLGDALRLSDSSSNNTATACLIHTKKLQSVSSMQDHLACLKTNEPEDTRSIFFLSLTIDRINQGLEQNQQVCNRTKNQQP